MADDDVLRIRVWLSHDSAWETAADSDIPGHDITIIIMLKVAYYSSWLIHVNHVIYCRHYSK